MKRVIIPLLLILLTNSQAWCVSVVVGQPATAATCAGGSAGSMGDSSSASSESKNLAHVILYEYVTVSASNDGEVSYGHCYTANTTGVTRVGVWTQTGTLLASTSEMSAASGATLVAAHGALSSTVCLASGTTYIVGQWVHDTADAWISFGISSWDSGKRYYSQELTTFGDFTPADTVTANYNCIVTVNSSSGGF